jgi:hypothetical protein
VRSFSRSPPAPALLGFLLLVAGGAVGECDRPIFTDLRVGSYLSLGQVVRLHTPNPELFAWCR